MSILIGLLAIAGIVVMAVKRPKLRLSAHRTLVARVAPFFFIAWGATIWALIIAKSAFDNVLATVAGSLMGLYWSIFLLQTHLRVEFRCSDAALYKILLAQRSGFAARDVRRGFAPPVAYKNMLGLCPRCGPEALNC